MIKNHLKKKIIISMLSLFIISIISIIPVNKKYEETIKYNTEFNYIYLLNDNYLVRTTITSDNKDILNKIKEIISALTIDSNIHNYLNNNYQQIIPKNTKLISIKLENKLLKLNFSKELLNVDQNLEEKMIESIIYSLTEFDEIDKIIIYVENELLTKLPNSNKELPLELTKDYGINKIYNITNLSNITRLTLYYFKEIDNNYNAVPVTIFTNSDKDKVEIIIKELKSSIAYQTDLVSFLSNNTKLLDYEIKEKSIKLNFSNALLDDFYNENVIEEVKYALSNSLKESLNLNEVTYYIDGKQI